MDTLDRGVQAGAIDDEQLDEIERSDIILSGYTCAGEQTYVLAQVSVGVNLDLVFTAIIRSALLSNATGRPVIPVVVGTSFTAESEARAEADGITRVLLWW